MKNLFSRFLAQLLVAWPVLFVGTRRTLAALLAVMAGTVGAKAQDVDWVLNLNDTGSDPLPAGGTIVYTATVANDSNC